MKNIGQNGRHSYMISTSRLSLLLLGAASFSLIGQAQEEDILLQDTIVVKAERSNPMLANVEPEASINVAELRSFGADSLASLLSDLEPLTRSSRGDGEPAILLNGRRVSGFREIRNYPPEALARVEILPETVALKFGFRADQKVINFVLRDRFHAMTGAASFAAPTEGGQFNSEIDISNLRIRNDRRWNADFNIEHNDALFESDRDIVSNNEESADRSLQPERLMTSLTGSYSHFLQGDVAATYTIGLDVGDQVREISQAGTLQTRDRDIDSLGANASFVFNKVNNDWNWTLSGRAIYEDSDNQTEPALLTGFSNRSRSTSDLISLEGVVFFKLAQLPAGDAVSTLNVGAEAENLTAQSLRSDTLVRTELSRDSLNAQINFDVPLFDRNMAGNPFGDISLNLNARRDDLSDSGTLETYGLGLTWHPMPTLQIIASSAHTEDAPTLQSLGKPLTLIDDARVFDFSTGATLDGIERLSGGNINLRPETRKVRDLNLSWDAFEEPKVKFNMAYSDTEIEDAIFTPPGLTPTIEAAFPERVVRDSSSELVRLDLRPINIAESKRREISYGLNWSKKLLGPERPDFNPEERQQLRKIFFQRLDEEDRARVEERIAEREANRAALGDGRSQGTRRSRRSSGRLFASFKHTAVLKDILQISPDAPRLDLLDGDAIDNRGGTIAHKIIAQTGASRGPLRAFMRVRWQSGTEFIDRSGTGLRYDDLTTANVRFQYNFGNDPKLLLDYPFLDSTRVSLSVDNLFDAKQQVTDLTGSVPLKFQSDLLDPLGRTVSLKFRKLYY